MCRAFTLIESLLASVILAAAVIAIATALNSAYANTARVDDDAAAVSLARQMMQQLASLPYRNATAERDSVIEYDGFADSFSPTGTSRTGASVSTGSGRAYERSVSVRFRAVPPVVFVNSAATELGASAVETDLAIVTVSVTTPGGRIVELTQLFSDVATQ